MMVLYSHTRSYTVVARLRGDVRRLIARTHGGEERLLVIADDAAAAKRLLPSLLSLLRDDAFPELYELFPHEGGLCAVFACPAARLTLAESLSRATPGFRAAALRSLFARLLALEPSPLLWEDMLRPENIVCTDSGEIGFWYDLHFVGGELCAHRTKALLRLGEAAEQIGGGLPSESLTALTERLRSCREESLCELYALALQAADELEHSPPPPCPPTLSAKTAALMETIQKRTLPWITALLLALWIAALFLLFYQTVIAPPPVDNGFARIGTVMTDGR